MSVLSLSACTSTRPCAAGTVFLTLTFDQATESASTLDIGLSLDGGAVEHQTKDRSAGQRADTLRVDFAHSYPTGSTLTIDIVALNNAIELRCG